MPWELLTQWGLERQRLGDILRREQGLRAEGGAGAANGSKGRADQAEEHLCKGPVVGGCGALEELTEQLEQREQAGQRVPVEALSCRSLCRGFAPDLFYFNVAEINQDLQFYTLPSLTRNLSSYPRHWPLFDILA